MSDFDELRNEYNKLALDIDRWAWIRDKQSKGINITVWLDNDETGARFDDEEDGESLRFNDPIGNMYGVTILLDLLKIKSEYV